MPPRFPPPIDRVLRILRVDWNPPRRQPSVLQVLLATALAIAGSLAVDAALVALGTLVFPSTRGYGHFRFPDYAKLTVVGVVIASMGWPIVTRITSTPRWLFLRLAILVTAVLLVPDVWLLLKGQPGEAVIVLISMHLAIALVTYNVLVHVAPAARSEKQLVTDAQQRA